jgi:thiol-disulfide isomerase/thioredoxin
MARLIMFHGRECPHCKKMLPLIEKLEGETPVRFEKLDLVDPRQRVRGAEPGYAGTDDRYLHLNGDSSETGSLDDRSCLRRSS